jgi:predicted GNAT family N-acyltransferase
MRLGQILMAAVEQRARNCGLRGSILNAQVDVIPFYEKLGYLAEGEIFEDAGIPHRTMRKQLG